jgi:hypothetical protein
MLVYALDGADVTVGSFTVTISDVNSHDHLLGVEPLKIWFVHSGAYLSPELKFTKTSISTQLAYSYA